MIHSARDGYRLGDASTAGRMSFVEHLRELRLRLIYCSIALLVATGACWSFRVQLFELLRRPLSSLATNQTLIVLSPLEQFVTYLKLSVLASVFVTSPFVLLQIWRFVSPGLYDKERRWLTPFVFLGSLFFCGGAAFAFYVVLPIGFAYLVAMVPEGVLPQYSVAVYFSLVIRMLLAFGLVFELPLFMWILAAARIVKPSMFRRFRKYWVVVSLACGAILTPPDPLTQIMMAVPLILFFELGLLGARVLYRDA